MNHRLYYFNEHGHHCTGTDLGHYRMDPAWIDTDNCGWSEPVHSYTEFGPRLDPVPREDMA